MKDPTPALPPLASSELADVIRQSQAPLLEHLPAAVLILDTSWHILFANQAAASTLKFARGELERCHVNVIVPEQLHERYARLREDAVRETASEGVLMRGERILRTREGREFPVELTLSRLHVNGHELLLAAFTDISSHKEREQETIEQLHSIVEHAEVGIFLVQVIEDGSYVFEAFNSVTEKLTGLRSEQARGRKPDQIVPPEEAARITENYRRCATSGLAVTYEESPGPIALGKTFRTTLVPIRNRQGQVHRMIGLAQDITEQKEAESALAATRRSLDESEAKFRKAFSVSPHPITITELATGKLLEVNDAFERLFGHTRADALGKTTPQLGIWRDPDARSRMVALASEQGAFRGLEIFAIDHQGNELCVLLSGEAVELHGIRCLVTYVHDITEDRANKLALAASEERFSKAFRASPDALAIVENESGRIFEVNDGFVRLFGRPRSEILGRSSLDLGLWVDPLVREQARALISKQGFLRDFPIQAELPSGTIRDCLLSAESLELGGRSCAVTIIRDVTDAMQAERTRADLERQLRQSQKLDALGTLAGGIAHDFNNILAAILTYAELIRLDVRNADLVTAHLTELRTAGDRATELVRQILTFSRKQPLQSRRAMRLEDPIREALSLVRAALSATVQLDATIDPHAPVVLADATQIHQIVMNLCTNAVQAMKQRQGRLTVCLDAATIDEATAARLPQLQPGSYARLSITDTGEGIAPEALKHIFEPFFTTKSPGEGTGLGLAVVHGIIREHEGTILVDSSVGSGTSMVVYLPEYEEQLRTSIAPKSDLTRGHGERLLLVDDEAVLCQSVTALLERLGYHVDGYTDPCAALANFRDHPHHYDLVLTDLTMPIMTGLDLAREIHALVSTMPIVVMTGFSGEHTSQSLRPIGVRELVHKPLSALRIAECIATCLKQPTFGTSVGEFPARSHA